MAATSVPVAIAALQPGSDSGRVLLYAVTRELVPGNLPTMTLALELATTLSRERDEALIIGPLAPSELEAAGLTIPPAFEHCEGVEDLQEWAATVGSRPGDLIVVPIHEASNRSAAIRVYRSGGSVLAVSQNPETSAESVVSPMNLPVGRSLGT